MASQDGARTTEGRDIATTEPDDAADRDRLIDQIFAEAIDECRASIELGDEEAALEALDIIEERALDYGRAFPNVKVL